jgi:hypothetical protein
MKHGLTLNLIRSFALLLLALAVPASFGKADRPQPNEAQAQLLDHGEYLCNNCLFGTSDYYYCFKAGDKILIGHNKIPGVNWQGPDKNYLTKAHKAWQPWQAEGASVNLKYDNKYIWLPRANGKDVRLTQDYEKDIFIKSPECRAAVKKK